MKTLFRASSEANSKQLSPYKHEQNGPNSCKYYSVIVQAVNGLLRSTIIICKSGALWLNQNSDSLSTTLSLILLNCNLINANVLKSFFSALSSANFSRRVNKSFSTYFLFFCTCLSFSFLAHHHAYSGKAVAKHALLSIMRLKHLPCPVGEVCRIQTVGENSL